MKPEHYFLIGLALLAIIVIYCIIKKCKKNKPDKFDKIPFVYYMHGKRFTPEEASEYYDIQKKRGIDPYLMVYDTKLKSYWFKGDYSYYEKEYAILRDSLYHE